MKKEQYKCIFAVDIDNTLCVEDEDYFAYAKAEPIKENIEKVNRLFENNTIVIYTARFEEDRQITEKWLNMHGVKYHRLVMGKLRADYYLDNDSFKMEEIVTYEEFKK